MISSMVFLAIVFSDYRVTNCLFPRHTEELDQVMQSFPLMVGIVCSGLFLVSPNTRYGIVIDNIGSPNFEYRFVYISS